MQQHTLNHDEVFHTIMYTDKSLTLINCTIYKGNEEDHDRLQAQPKSYSSDANGNLHLQSTSVFCHPTIYSELAKTFPPSESKGIYIKGPHNVNITIDSSTAESQHKNKAARQELAAPAPAAFSSPHLTPYTNQSMNATGYHQHTAYNYSLLTQYWHPISTSNCALWAQDSMFTQDPNLSLTEIVVYSGRVSQVDNTLYIKGTIAYNPAAKTALSEVTTSANHNHNTSAIRIDCQQIQTLWIYRNMVECMYNGVRV